MDIDRLRADFPILAKLGPGGRPIAYLDSAATSQKPTSVVRAEDDYYATSNANVHRGVYQLSIEATDAYEGAREKVAKFVGAREASEVVFLRGTTEAINLLATSLGRSLLHRGDGVVLSLLEHHSNIVPWHLLREYQGIGIDYVGITEDGRLDLADLEAKLARGRTKVVSLAHVSNVLGTVAPIREIAERAHDAGALVVVDAAQSAPHRPIDVERLGVDFLAFSGHKMLGPMGIGALWGRADRLDALPPCMGGGEMIREVHTDRVAYAAAPARFEAGTPNVAGAVGLGAAIDYLGRVGWDDIQEHGKAMTRLAYRLAQEQLGDRIRIYGPPEGPDREPVISFALRGVHPHDIASLLDADGICVRAGQHCAQPLMERFGVPALTRASPYLYNTEEEIVRLFDSLAKVATLFERATTSKPAGS